MKTFCLLSILISFALVPFPACFGQSDRAQAEPVPAFVVAADPHKLQPILERELKGCFEFFWNESVSDPALPTYGLTNGNGVGMGPVHPISIEGQGFYFATIVIGVERGWITRANKVFDDVFKR